MTVLLIIFCVGLLTVLALATTFVLFKYLSSWAEGQTPLLGGTIKYGGSLAGFVLIFVLLSFLLERVTNIQQKLRTDHEYTSINLDGGWLMTSYVNGNKHTLGSACIKQSDGSRFLSMAGIIENSKFDKTKPNVSFSTHAGQIAGNIMYVIYQNSDEEMGVGKGIIVGSGKVSEFSFQYTDLINSDKNDNPSGQITFNRHEKGC